MYYDGRLQSQVDLYDKEASDYTFQTRSAQFNDQIRFQTGQIKK